MSGHLIKPVRISKNSKPLICPPDKSITHRSFLFSLLSPEVSHIRNPLMGQDCLASLAAVNKLGANVIAHTGSHVEIRGFGVGGFSASAATTLSNRLSIDCQNSGTTMRLLTGLLAGQKGFFRLTGDESLSQRPMARVSEPLSQMGAKIFPRGKNSKGVACPPIEIDASDELHGIKFQSKVASAQVKSAVLLAGLFCTTGETLVQEPSLSRDHTERMLRSMGVAVHSSIDSSGNAIASVKPAAPKLAPLNISVGGDPSSAAFWACGALMQEASVSIERLLLNPTRLGFVSVLKRMGAVIQISSANSQGGEEVGAILVKRANALQATEVLAHEIPSMVDEVPMLAITAVWARGTTVFRGVQELRVKESDRLAAIISFIQSIGGNAWAGSGDEANDLFVEGLGRAPHGPSEKNWSYQTLGDHRLAMAAIITADALHSEINLDDIECIKVSYPNFFEHREALA